MGERPVYATHAHVFQIDPQTKKKWLPSSTQAVRVSYYYDPNRKTYRIITMENKEVLINSTITANMTFTKTSPKFGQWSDHRANTVFGLGFSSEKDLIQFQEKFSEAKGSAKELLEQRRRQKKDAGSSAGNTSSTSNADNTLSPTSSIHNLNNGSTSSDAEQEPPISAPTPDTTPIRPKEEPQVVKETISLQQPSSTHTTPVSSLAPKKLTTDSPQLSNNKPNERLTEEANVSKHNNSTLDSQVDSLKFENSKLKVALASSAQNVKKWESEMQTLRNNNAMLTTALEESTQHVAEWKRQLQKYKEDCDTLKKKVEAMDAIERENEELKDVLSSVQVDLEQRTEELEAKSSELMESQKTIKAMAEEKRQGDLRLKAVEEKSQRAASASKEKLASAQQTVQQLNHSLETIMRSCQTLSSQLHD